MAKPESTGALLWGGVFLGLTTILIWSRMVGLDLSFWNDEVFTVVNYARKGPDAIFFDAYLPNNHVLFEITAWATTSIFGQSETIYRLWGWLPALVATGWIAWWASRRFGHLVATTVLILMVVSPLILQLSREARGYGLCLLAIVGLITQADSALTEFGRSTVWRFASFGLLGVLTLPVFALPYVFFAIPLLFESRIRRRLTVAVAVSGLVALVWYSPMLLEILENASQQYGQPVPWHGFVTFSMLHLVFPVFRLLLPGNPDITLGDPQDDLLLTLVWHAVAWALMALGGRWLWRRSQRMMLASLVLSVIGTYLTMAVFGMWVVDRFVSYLSLPVFVLMALGIKALAESKSAMPRRVVGTALAGMALWLVLSFIPVADLVTRVPHEALKDAALVANDSGAKLVVTNASRPVGFEYYLEVAPEILSSTDLEALFCGKQSGYVFLNQVYLAEPLDTSCLEAKSAVQIRLEQRGRGYHLDVWLVGLPGGTTTT